MISDEVYCFQRLIFFFGDKQEIINCGSTIILKRYLTNLYTPNHCYWKKLRQNFLLYCIHHQLWCYCKITTTLLLGSKSCQRNAYIFCTKFKFSVKTFPRKNTYYVEKHIRENFFWFRHYHSSTKH